MAPAAMSFTYSQGFCERSAMRPASALAAVAGNDEKNEEVIQAAQAMAALKGIKEIRVEQEENFFVKPFETDLEEIA